MSESVSVNIVHQKYYTATVHNPHNIYVTADTRKELQQKLKDHGLITDPRQYPKKFAYKTIKAKTQ